MDAITLNAVAGLDIWGIANTVAWHFFRVGAMFAAMPLVGGNGLPRKVRLVLALSLSAILSGFLPEPPPAAFNATTALLVMKEVFIGIGMGFCLRLAFESGRLAGELISQSMALSMAQLSDPVNGSSSAVISVWFHITFALLFFTMDGHLAILSALVQSYELAPIETVLPNLMVVASTIPTFFTTVLYTAVTLSLPVMLALVAINICFGVLSKAAPQLNPIQLGLPVVLLVGTYMLAILFGELERPIQAVLHNGLEAAANFVR